MYVLVNDIIEIICSWIWIAVRMDNEFVRFFYIILVNNDFY